MPDWNKRVLAFDTETTGVGESARIVEVGCVLWDEGRVAVTMAWLLKPGDVDYADPKVADAMRVNQINPATLKDAPSFAQAFPEIRNALGQAPVRVAHNAPFDQRMLRQEFKRAVAEGKLPADAGKGKAVSHTLDTLALDLFLNPDVKGRKLEVVAARWGVSDWNKHRAAGDAEASVRILQAMAPRLPDEMHEVLEVQKEAQCKWQRIMDQMRARGAQKAVGP